MKQKLNLQRILSFFRQIEAIITDTDLDNMSLKIFRFFKCIITGRQMLKRETNVDLGYTKRLWTPSFHTINGFKTENMFRCLRHKCKIIFEYDNEQVREYVIEKNSLTINKCCCHFALKHQPRAAVGNHKSSHALFPKRSQALFQRTLIYFSPSRRGLQSVGMVQRDPGAEKSILPGNAFPKPRAHTKNVDAAKGQNLMPA